MNTYLLTNNPKVRSLISGTNFILTSVEEALAFTNDHDALDFDIETTGLDSHKEDIKTMQFRNGEVVLLVDCLSVDPVLFKEPLESKLLIGHNLKFDLQFLYSQRIVPTRVYDTYIAETILNLGDDLHKKSLDACALRYCNVVMDKTEQTNVSREFTIPFLRYAAIDVMYLSEIKAAQEKLIAEKECKVSLELNNRFVKVIAYGEWCGLKLDANKWTVKSKETEKIGEEKKQILDRFIEDNNFTDFLDSQMGLFGGSRVTINWNSSDQVGQLFKSLGMDISIKVDGVFKESVAEDNIRKYANDYPIVKTYLEYKEMQKDLSTYGYNWLAMIHPITGRIHTDFRQFVNTGRMASGRRGDKTKPNLQNIPSDEETRSCFVAEDGNVIIGCDYSQQEQVVLANKSLDPNLLEFFDQNIGDMHSFVASKMYANPNSSLFVPEMEGLSLKEIKSKFPELRNKAKMAGFTINYGGTGEGMASKLNVSKEEGVAIYNSYFEVFPKMKQFFDESKKEGIQKGYILISRVTGLKHYIKNYAEFKKDMDSMDKEFWERYRKIKNAFTPTAMELKHRVKRFFSRLSDLEKASLNYPIQGESAEMTKLAGVYFFERYLVKEDRLFTVKIINFVHDELLVEAPEDIQDEVSENLKKAMLDAADKFCKRVRMSATPTISTYWKK
jgi:DNA polymerase-1